jgi:hypothetical protein
MAAYTADQVRGILRHKACDLGSQKAVAEHLGVSNTFISDILTGKREPTGKVLIWLGLVRVVRYESIDLEAG